MKRYTLILGLAFIMIISLSSCDPDPAHTTIKNGFSNDLVDMLKKQYHVTIPKEAVFIKGDYDGFQDPVVSIKFKIPSDLCDTLYDDTWTEGSIETFSGSNDGIERVMEYKDEEYTYLGYYHVSDDGTVKVHFQGGNPYIEIT